MEENLKCIYITFDKVPIELREKAALSSEEVYALLTQLKASHIAKEIFTLSTCNRTEIYYVASQDLKLPLIQSISTFRKQEDITVLSNLFDYEPAPDKVARRLFLIGNGLLSNILGDRQIIRQVKSAYDLACKAGTAGPCLHRLLQLVFSSHKHVSSNTGIHTGGASVSCAAAEMALRYCRQYNNAKILIIGAGELSREVIGQLQKNKGRPEITIMNRNGFKSEVLAHQFGLKFLPFEVKRDLSDFNVVISCISASGFVFNKKNFCAESSPKLLVDLSVPRTFDSELNTEPGMTLVNIDQITEHNKIAVQKRKDAIPEAQQIINTYCSEFMEWQQASHAKPVLHDLKHMMEAIRVKEVNRHLKRHQHRIDSELIHTVTKNIINKIVKIPAIKLVQTSAENTHELKRLSDALMSLFDLDNNHKNQLMCD